MHERTYKQYIFRSYDTSTFNTVCFGENPFTCQCKKKKDKEAYSFIFRTFSGSF